MDILIWKTSGTYNPSVVNCSEASVMSERRLTASRRKKNLLQIKLCDHFDWSIPLVCFHFKGLSMLEARLVIFASNFQFVLASIASTHHDPPLPLPSPWSLQWTTEGNSAHSHSGSRTGMLRAISQGSPDIACTQEYTYPHKHHSIHK